MAQPAAAASPLGPLPQPPRSGSLLAPSAAAPASDAASRRYSVKLHSVGQRIKQLNDSAQRGEALAADAVATVLKETRDVFGRESCRLCSKPNAVLAFAGVPARWPIALAQRLELFGMHVRAAPYFLDLSSVLTALSMTAQQREGQGDDDDGSMAHSMLMGTSPTAASIMASTAAGTSGSDAAAVQRCAAPMAQLVRCVYTQRGSVAAEILAVLQESVERIASYLSAHQVSAQQQDGGIRRSSSHHHHHHLCPPLQYERPLTTVVSSAAEDDDDDVKSLTVLSWVAEGPEEAMRAGLVFAAVLAEVADLPSFLHTRHGAVAGICGVAAGVVRAASSVSVQQQQPKQRPPPPFALLALVPMLATIVRLMGMPSVAELLPWWGGWCDSRPAYALGIELARLAVDLVSATVRHAAAAADDTSSSTSADMMLLAPALPLALEALDALRLTPVAPRAAWVAQYAAAAPSAAPSATDTEHHGAGGSANEDSDWSVCDPPQLPPPAASSGPPTAANPLGLLVSATEVTELLGALSAALDLAESHWAGKSHGSFGSLLSVSSTPGLAPQQPSVLARLATSVAPLLLSHSRLGQHVAGQQEDPAAADGRTDATASMAAAFALSLTAPPPPGLRDRDDDDDGGGEANGGDVGVDAHGIVGPALRRIMGAACPGTFEALCRGVKSFGVVPAKSSSGRQGANAAAVLDAIRLLAEWRAAATPEKERVTAGTIHQGSINDGAATPSATRIRGGDAATWQHTAETVAALISDEGLPNQELAAWLVHDGLRTVATVTATAADSDDSEDASRRCGTRFFGPLMRACVRESTAAVVAASALAPAIAAVAQRIAISSARLTDGSKLRRLAARLCIRLAVILQATVLSSLDASGGSGRSLPLAGAVHRAAPAVVEASPDAAIRLAIAAIAALKSCGGGSSSIASSTAGVAASVCASLFDALGKHAPPGAGDGGGAPTTVASAMAAFAGDGDESGDDDDDRSSARGESAARGGKSPSARRGGRGRARGGASPRGRGGRASASRTPAADRPKRARSGATSGVEIVDVDASDDDDRRVPAAAAHTGKPTAEAAAPTATDIDTPEARRFIAMFAASGSAAASMTEAVHAAQTMHVATCYAALRQAIVQASARALLDLAPLAVANSNDSDAATTLEKVTVPLLGVLKVAADALLDAAGQAKSPLVMLSTFIAYGSEHQRVAAAGALAAIISVAWIKQPTLDEYGCLQPVLGGSSSSPRPASARLPAVASVDALAEDEHALTGAVINPTALLQVDPIGAPTVLAKMALSLVGGTPATRELGPAVTAALLRHATSSNAKHRAAALTALQLMTTVSGTNFKHALVSLDRLLAVAVKDGDTDTLAVIEDLAEVPAAPLLLQLDPVMCAWAARWDAPEVVARLNQCHVQNYAPPPADANDQQQQQQQAAAAATARGPYNQRMVMCMATLLLDLPHDLAATPELEAAAKEEIERRVSFAMAHVLSPSPTTASDTSIGQVLVEKFRFILTAYIALFVREHGGSRDDGRLATLSVAVKCAAMRLASVTVSTKTAAQVAQAFVAAGTKTTTRRALQEALDTKALAMLDILMRKALGGGSFGGGGGSSAAATTDLFGRVNDHERIGNAMHACPVPIPDVSTWVLCVCHLMALLGEKTCLIARKVPVFLAAALNAGADITAVSLAWLVLCRETEYPYVVQLSSAVAVDLVRTEDALRLAEAAATLPPAEAARARSMLCRAMVLLRTKASTSDFWFSLRFALSSTSEVVRKGVAVGISDELGGASHREQPMSIVTSGFTAGVQSSASTCRLLFVRALASCLTTTWGADEYRGLLEHRGNLLTALLACAADPNDQIRIPAMHCVGLLGTAVPTTRRFDPYHVMLEPDPSDMMEEDPDRTLSAFGTTIVARCRFHFDFMMVDNWSSEFLPLLLSVHCVSALSATSDEHVHDAAAYSTQQLLRIGANAERAKLGRPELDESEPFTNGPAELQAHPWWATLKASFLSVLEPYTRTTFMLQGDPVPPDPDALVFEHGIDAAVWLRRLYNRHLNAATGTHGRIFNALRRMVRWDSDLGTFLMPYLLINVAAAAPSSASTATTTTASTTATTTTQLTTPSQRAIVAEFQEVLRNAARAREHARAVFHCIDSMMHYVERGPGQNRVDEHLKQTRSADSQREIAERMRRRTAAIAGAKAVLHHIDVDLRFKAAIAVGAPARALRYFESPLKLPKTVANPLEIQSAFAQLDDADACSYFHAAVSEGYGWLGTALSSEQCGQYNDALQACERYLEERPEDPPTQMCALRCLQRMGMLHQMASMAASAVSSAAVRVQQNDRHRRGREVDADGADAPPPSTTGGVEEGTNIGIVSDGADSAEERQEQQLRSLQHSAAEAAWRLSRWDVLEAPGVPSAARAGVAGALTAFRRVIIATGANSDEKGGGTFTNGGTVARHLSRLQAVMDGDRQRSANTLAAANEGVAHVTPALGSLHVLGDIELAARAVASSPASSAASATFTDPTGTTPEDKYLPLVRVLDARLQAVERTPRAQDTLLAVHRAVFGLLGMDGSVAKRWLDQAAVLRDAGMLDAALAAAERARSYVNRANAAKAPEPAAIRVEELTTSTSANEVNRAGLAMRYYDTVARLTYESGRAAEAVDFARRHMNRAELPKPVRARLMLLATDWSLEVGGWAPTDAIARFRETIAMHDSEAAQYALGRYVDRMFAAAMPDLQARDGRLAEVKEKEAFEAIDKLAPSVIEHYGRALRFGKERAYLCLPRLLTCWLDGTKVAMELTLSQYKARAAASIGRLNHRVEAALLGDNAVSPALVVTALPQLVSRLGHPNYDAMNVLFRLLSQLLRAFPQQTLWSILAVVHSNTGRTRLEYVRQQVLQPYAELVKSDSAKLAAFNMLQQIFRAMIELCQYSSTSITQSNTKMQSLPFIKRLEDANAMEKARVIIPTADTLTPRAASASSSSTSSVFPTTPTFSSFDDAISIMASLQKPKRIGVFSDHGNIHHFLCKAKDEPRKDMRMMELAALANDVLRDHPEAARRHLRMRRYAVTALTDDCALIEWVPGLEPLRKVCDELYNAHGLGLRTSALRALKDKMDRGQLTPIQMVRDNILPHFPAILHVRFQTHFRDPHEWYTARGLFTRSTAVWSMFGHLVGLGDRHGENLLLHSSGELCHCDFACMFDKGEALEVPERVRFRLTQNVVDAMGITGTEGAFRRACELSLAVAAKHKAMIVGLLETFVHDPLVEWVAAARGTSASSSSSRNNPKLLIARVVRRLDGHVDLYGDKDTVALSTEGQVTKLVHASQSLDALSRMYMWWMPWI